jgi:hypothetical protein
MPMLETKNEINKIVKRVFVREFSDSSRIIMPFPPIIKKK